MVNKLYSSKDDQDLCFEKDNCWEGHIVAQCPRVDMPQNQK